MTSSQVTYRLLRGVSAHETSTGLVISHGDATVELDGPDVGILRVLLDALAVPRTVRQLARQLAFDASAVEDALAVLQQLDVVSSGPPLRVAFYAPAARTDLVALRAMLRPLAVDLRLVSVDACGEVDATTPALFGPFELNDAAAWRLFETVAQHHDHVAPVWELAGHRIVGPASNARACPQCARLRLLARLDPHRAQQELTSATAAPRWRGPSAWRVDLVATAIMRWLSERPPTQYDEFAAPVLAAPGAAEALAWRPVLWHDACPQCGSRSPAAMSKGPTHLTAAARSALVDPMFGPIFEAEKAEPGAARFRGLPFVWGGTARVADGCYLSTGYHGIAGTGVSVEQRRLVLAYEGIERYALRARAADVRDASAIDLGDACVDVSRIPTYDEDAFALPGFPRARFDPATALHWARARGLVSGAEKLLPWELVRVALDASAYPQRVFDTFGSSGAAAHVTQEQAVLGALRELIERDAFLCTWLKRLPRPPIEIADGQSGDDVLDELLRFVRARLDVKLIDLRVDFAMPVVAAVATARKTEGALVPGSRLITVGGGFSPVAACTRALMELALFFEMYALAPPEANDWRTHPYRAHDVDAGYSALSSAVMWPLDPSRAETIRFLEQTPLPAIALTDIPTWPAENRALPELVDAFRLRQLEAWVVDVTPRDLQFTGAAAVRIVAPGLVPLEGTLLTRRIPHARVEAVAARSAGGGLPAGQVNPDPHPVV